MKKMTLLLLLVLVVGLLALPVSAQEAHPHSGSHCICGGSAVGNHDHACADVTWQPLSDGFKSFSTLASGNYYLTEDVTVTDPKAITANLTVCLNGYNIYTTANTVFTYIDPGAVLNICDCSGTYENGMWTWDGTVYANQTEGASRNYGAIMNTQANSIVRIFGGNFVGCKAGGTKNGGVFNVCNDDYQGAGATSNTDAGLYTSFTFYNGHVYGGHATASGGIINTWHNPTVRLYGGYFEGGTCDAANGGSLGLSASTKCEIDGTVITGAAPADVLVMQGYTLKSRHSTLSAALAKVGAGQYLRLTGDVNESVTVPAGTLIDLNGNTLSGVTVAEGALFMDTATDHYYGEYAGRLIPASGEPASNVKTTEAQVGAIKRYLTVQEEEGYSFHRFYMAVTKASIAPTTVGVGYKARFVGSEYVEQGLSNTTAFGYTMWLEGGNKVMRGHTADKFGGNQELTLRINKFLSTNLSTAENSKRGETPVYASVYVRLADGTVIETDPVRYTFRDMLEAANANYASYSTVQKNSLINLSSKFSGSMIPYDIDNFHHVTGSVWKSHSNQSFNALLDKGTTISSGSYVLTEDVDIGARTIRINAGRTVSICLNGHTLHSDARLFRVYGTLNLCDCHADGYEGTYQSADSYDNDDTDIGEFAPVMYCYYNSVTNFYGGNMKATRPITYAGLVAISHDGNDKTQPSAIFNMYGGTMHGNTVDGGGAVNKSGNGGAVCIWNGGTFNMYGGTVIGGTAHFGASVYIGGATCTMNMYGGTIKDGKVAKRTDAEGVTSAARGGNVYNGGIFNMYGGNISGGVANEGQGGNMYSYGPVAIYGGTITGGKATSYTNQDGEQLYNSAQGGGIYLYDEITYISGETRITGNSNGNIYLAPRASVNIEKLTGDAKIGLFAETTGAVSGDTTTAAYLTSDKSGYSFYTVNNRVMYGTSKPATFKENLTSFSVGYSIVDITPTEAGLTMSKWGNPNGRETDGSVGYALKATTVAITDKQNTTVLMVTLDLQSIGDAYAEQFSQIISAATGVPADQVYISTTHTHNCPSVTDGSQGNARYVAYLGSQLVTGAVNAMADRGSATMKTGQFETQGLNYTRNYYYYLNNDKTTEPIYFGDQFGQAPQNKETIYRIREGDHTMHMIEFARSGKKPVLIVNWRAHPHRSGGMWTYSSDADVIGATREYFQNNTDYLFAYYQGAAGNMNTTSRISGETFGNKTQMGVAKYIKVFGDELGRQIMTNGIPKLKTAATGLIQTDSYVYAAPVNHDDEIYYEDAQRLWDYHEANPDKMDSYQEQINEANSLNPDGTRKYEGVYSVYHAQQIIARHNLGETKDIHINTFSIGKSVAFCTSAGEIWDRVGEEMEERSEYPETWFMAYCDGGVGYIPYGVAGNYESYEYYSCVFKQDEVILQIMDYLEGFLIKQWKNAK